MIHSFPKKHIFAAAFIGTLLIIVLALSPSTNVNATRIPIDIELLNNSTPTKAETSQTKLQPDLSVDPKAISPTDNTSAENWATFSIKSGDTLSDLFLKAGLNDKIMYRVLYDHPDNKTLTRIFPGEKIAFLTTDNHDVEKIKLVSSPVESVLYTKNDNGKF